MGFVETVEKEDIEEDVNEKVEEQDVVAKTVEKQEISPENENEEQLYFTHLLLMYNLCRYGKAWNDNELSPWCAAFEQEDLEVSKKPLQCFMKRLTFKKML